MKLYIDFSSIWQGILLEGSDSKSYFNKVRKPITKGYNPKPPFCVDITKNTVMGVIYRLTGEQRKLSQLNDYLNLENKIKFEVKNRVVTEEIMALRRAFDKGVDNPSGYCGIAQKEQNAMFLNPEYYQRLLYPLTCSPSKLYDFIVNNVPGRDPNLVIYSRLDYLDLANKAKAIRAKDVFSDQERQDMIEKFSKASCLSHHEYKHGAKSNYIVFVNSAIYLAFENIIKEFGLKPELFSDWKKGISARSITPKDMVGHITKGTNPVINYIMKETRQTNPIKKLDGTLVVEIDDSDGKIKELIDSANVGCFNVGKKGLGYVREIL